MKAQPRVVALWIAVWLAIAAGAGVLVRIADATPQAMPRDELERSVRQLHSDALEARTLALALAAGQLTANFGMQQHRMIADDLRDVRQALDKPPPREGAHDAERVRDAVERLDALLRRVPVSLADAAALRAIADEEGALARDLPRAGP